MVGILTVCTCCMVDLKAQGREELTCFNAEGDGGSGRSCPHWELSICFNWTNKLRWVILKGASAYKMGEWLLPGGHGFEKAGIQWVGNNLGSVSEVPGDAEPAGAAGGVESGRLAPSSASCPRCSLACSVSFAALSKERLLFLVLQWVKNARQVNTNSLLCLEC